MGNNQLNLQEQETMEETIMYQYAVCNFAEKRSMMISETKGSRKFKFSGMSAMYKLMILKKFQRKILHNFEIINNFLEIWVFCK